MNAVVRYVEKSCFVLSHKFVCRILVFFIVLLSICVVLLASVPPVSRDALTHLLYVPKLWLQSGSIAPIPHISGALHEM